MKIAILKNELPNSAEKWIVSCRKFGIDYQIIDLTCFDWHEKVLHYKPDILLLKPSGLTAPFKELYDERLKILVEEHHFFCYPSLKEVLVYENKRYLSYWLKSQKIAHPETYVFYKESEALSHCDLTISFPIVAKTNIGASGSGVMVIPTKTELVNYIKNTFSGAGENKRFGPNLKKGKIISRGIKLLLNPKRLRNRIEVYEARAKDIQKDFVLLQQFIQHEFEWRVVRIGKSFFAHKKLLLGEKTSGSLEKSYCTPPISLLNFVKSLTDQQSFDSVSIDIFEHNETYMVNEIQCIFGQSDGFQMKVDGEIGRYVHLNDKWQFEKGDFNTNENYDLRLAHAISKFKENQ